MTELMPQRHMKQSENGCGTDQDVADVELTPVERNAINSLKRLAKRWPDSLWLFSASGGLHVMKGGKLSAGDGHDQNAIVETIHGIGNDGGDW